MVVYCLQEHLHPFPFPRPYPPPSRLQFARKVPLSLIVASNVPI
jgi:hypothetical protein